MTDRELLEKLLEKLVTIENRMVTKDDLYKLESKIVTRIENSTEDLQVAIDILGRHEHQIKLVK